MKSPVHSVKSAGFNQPALSVIPDSESAPLVSARPARALRYVFCVPMLVLCFAAHGWCWFFSGAVNRGVAVTDSMAYVPTISNVEGDLFGGGGEGRLGKERAPDGESEMRLFGRFDINNVRRVPFLLRVIFGNGGVLKPAKGAGGSIRLEGLVLRYRDGGAVTRERVLSSTEYRGGGYIYEVMFWDEDVQELYNVELWGSLNRGDVAGAGAGSFRESARLEIEKL